MTHVVTQADRDAVQAFHRGMADRLMSDIELGTSLLDVKGTDDDAIYQAFAAHRIAAIAKLEAERAWQPIETAPKDGTVIILGSLAQDYQGKPVAPRSTVGHWSTDEECREVIGDCGGECRCPEYKFHDPLWLSWDGGFTDENPATHWQPLPEPPTPTPGN